MITLIKSEEYFKQLRETKKDSVLYISNTDKNNLSLYELHSLFRNNLYKYYFFEYTPYMDFFANYNVKSMVEIYLLIENSCYIPITLSVKSNIIMEKSEKNFLKDFCILRKKVMNILIENKNAFYFKSLMKDMQFVFFSRDIKTAYDLLEMLKEKYNFIIIDT
jgi:hypothetical protein